MQALLRIGMAPAATSETAAQARARFNKNEAKLAEFVVDLEQNAAVQNREQIQRLQDLTLIVKEVCTACEQQLHSVTLTSLAV